MTIKFKKDVIDKVLQHSREDADGQDLSPEKKVYFLAKSIAYFRPAVVGVDMDDFLNNKDKKTFTKKEAEAARTYDLLMDADITAWDEVFQTGDINVLEKVFYEELSVYDIEFI